MCATELVPAAMAARARVGRAVSLGWLGGGITRLREGVSLGGLTDVFSIINCASKSYTSL